MDVDFWAARIHSAKHLSAARPTHFDHSDMPQAMRDGGDEDIRVWFPCPFCYVEIEVPSLCGHLQDEHSFSLENAVCPICAVNLGNNVTDHFTQQHAILVKRRRKSQRSGNFWNNAMGVRKELRKLSSYLDKSSRTSSSGSIQEIAPDPILLPFLISLPASDIDEKLQDLSSETASQALNVVSNRPEQSVSADEQDPEERRMRAEFSQELVMSTIFRT